MHRFTLPDSLGTFAWTRKKADKGAGEALFSVNRLDLPLLKYLPVQTFNGAFAAGPI